LESYLAGVLAGEVPVGRWHDEALKAQAIASRSYAIHQMKAHTHDPYDVESTVADQVFKPLRETNPKLEAILVETEGLIVTRNGRIFPAYFHSTCGGHTAAAHRAFPDRGTVFDTLGGVRCPFCTASPAFEWRARIAKTEMERKLRSSAEARKTGKRFGRITAIEAVGGTGWPRRADRFRIRHTGGALTVPAQRFRLIVGPGNLKSACVTRIVDRGSEFEFQGRGFGHGVGMCQYGSQGMASKGYSYRQILGFYYPGGELTRLYDRSLAKVK
jgi:stage II sporulation protein D